MCEANGISPTTLNPVLNERDRVDGGDGEKFVTPGKKRPKLNVKSNIDDFDKAVCVELCTSIMRVIISYRRWLKSTP